MDGTTNLTVGGIHYHKAALTLSILPTHATLTLSAGPPLQCTCTSIHNQSLTAQLVQGVPLQLKLGAVVSCLKIDEIKANGRVHSPFKSDDDNGVRGDPWGVYGTPLGPATGCMMHKLAYETALNLLPDQLPPGSLRRRQVWDTLLSGDMTQAGMGDCSGTTATPPPGTARLTPPSFAAGPPDLAVFADGATGSDTAAGTVWARNIAKGTRISVTITP